MFDRYINKLAINSIVFGLVLIFAPTLLVRASSKVNNPAFDRSALVESYNGAVQLEGEVAFNARLSPSVAQLGDTLTLSLTAQNNTAQPLSPEIKIKLPAGVLPSASSIPAGATLNLQNLEISWSPVLNGQGGTAQESFELQINSINAAEPEQVIVLSIFHGSDVRTTELAFWAGETPTGDFTVFPETASVGQPIQLNAAVASNGPVNQTWMLSDGRQILAQNPMVVFPEVGTHTITLFLTNPAGTTAIDKTVTIVPEPAAFISLDTSTPNINEPVQFSSVGGGQQPLSYYWDFGDGTFSTEPNPQHQYPVAGVYTVVYTVGNEYGQAQNFVEITVGSPPAADLILPGSSLVGNPLDLQIFIDESVQTILWDMGDGTKLEGLDISHTYQTPGLYTIQMEAISSFGSATVSRVVEISSGPAEIYMPLVMREMLLRDEPVGDGAGEERTLSLSTVAKFEGEVEIVLVDNEAIAGADLAAQLYWYINDARQQAGLTPVSLVPELNVAAKQHTNDMAEFEYTGHTGSDGTHPYERVARVGYSSGGYAGETTAWGFRTPRAAVEFWLQSPPHRAILLNPIADEVGVAQTTNYNAPNVWYWTAEFASTLGSITDQMLEAGVRAEGHIPNEPLPEDTIIFYWYWPLPLAADQTFVLYSVENEVERRIGSINQPIDVQKPFNYGYPVQGLNLASRVGETEWLVKLETAAGEERTRSETGIVTIFGVWPTATPAPIPPTLTPTATILVVPTETPIPTATLQPLGETGNGLTPAPTEIPVEPTATPTPSIATENTVVAPQPTVTPVPTGTDVTVAPTRDNSIATSTPSPSP